MAKKSNGGAAPVPRGNQSRFGPGNSIKKSKAAAAKGAPASEQDTKRRLGNYGTAGEHPIEQPDGKKGSNH